MRGFITVRTWC